MEEVFYLYNPIGSERERPFWSLYDRIDAEADNSVRPKMTPSLEHTAPVVIGNSGK